MKSRHKQPPAPRPADLDSTPVAGAAAAIALTRQKSGGDLTNQKAGRLHQTITDRVDEIRAGDLSLIDEVLTAQVHTLTTLSNQLISEAATEKRVGVRCEYLRLALQAQQLLVKTCNSLNEKYNPKRVMFIKNQQNNLLLQEDPTHAAMDTRSQIEASGVNQELATVVAFHRTPDPAG